MSATINERAQTLDIGNAMKQATQDAEVRKSRLRCWVAKATR